MKWECPCCGDTQETYANALDVMHVCRAAKPRPKLVHFKEVRA